MAEISAALLGSLRRLYRVEGAIKPGATAREFLARYGLGRPAGRDQWQMTQLDREQLRETVFRLTDVDLERADIKALKAMPRDEMAQVTANEKLTPRAVREGRVAIKALPGRALLLGPSSIELPSGMSVDAEWQAVARDHGHRSILLVENWIAFERIHTCDLDLTPAGSNPLVLFRGSDVYSAAASKSLLEDAAARGVGVWGYVDLDPAGLLIASTLPGLAGLIAPDPDSLQQMLAERSNYKHETYLKQLPAAQSALDGTSDARIRVLWEVLKARGAAVPQEVFHRNEVAAKRRC